MNKELVDIVKSCAKGNLQSQRLLYEKLSDKMFGVCLQYCSNYEEAKDILQDGFIKVFRSINQYKFKGHFEGWARRIFVNTALEKYRSQKMKFADSEVLDYTDKFSSDDLVSNISASEILEIVQQLSPQYKLVFNLYAIEGYSHKEISEKLGISIGTSKSNLSRARIILQNKILESEKVLIPYNEQVEQGY